MIADLLGDHRSVISQVAPRGSEYLQLKWPDAETSAFLMSVKKKHEGLAWTRSVEQDESEGKLPESLELSVVRRAQKIDEVLGKQRTND